MDMGKMLDNMQPAVKQETKNVAVYTVVGVVLMWLVFLVLHLAMPEKVPFNYTVILGGLGGGDLVENLAAAGLAVLFGDVGQLLHDDLVDACRALENILQVRNRVFEFFNFLGAL